MSLNKDITIRKAKEKRLLLEKDILDLIKIFKNKTELKICDIHFYLTGDNIKHIITKVEIKI